MLTLKKVAVTGGLASGKTSVCRILENLGAYIVSADEIVHQLLSPSTPVGQQVISLLGSDIVRNHDIDRKKIAEKVFSQPNQLKALEALLHPAVLDEVKRRYNAVKSKGNSKLFVAEIPLLYESESESFFDAVITVMADPALARKRFTQKTDHSPLEFERRMERQLDPHHKAARADFVIVNNGTFEELNDAVGKVFLTLRQQL